MTPFFTLDATAWEDPNVGAEQQILVNARSRRVPLRKMAARLPRAHRGVRGDDNHEVTEGSVTKTTVIAAETA